MKTNREIKTHFRVANSDYGILTIPAGTRVTNQTATGIDPNVFFIDVFNWVKPHEGGVPKYGLIHDLKHYGLRVPE